jgi:hypothetical protein
VASTNDRLRQATADVFESWTVAATSRLTAAGIAADESRRLAIMFIELLEGAFLLCRARRTTEPMEVAGDAITAAIRAAVPARRRRPGR